MFRWCSYCQCLIGEADPLSDYRISHGICTPCSQRLSSNIAESELEIELLRASAIFEMLEETGRGGRLDACDQIINDALDFGLKPSDIIVGILHPSLHRIGELWERGEISVAEEHRFTNFALGLIDRLKFAEPAADRPLVILANHPESLHEVGLRLLQLVCWEHGIPCERIPPGASEVKILDAASERSPIMFGLSVSLVETIPGAVELATSIAARLPDASRMVLGGQAFRRSESYWVPECIAVMNTIDEFLVHLNSIKKQYPDPQAFADADRKKKGRVAR